MKTLIATLLVFASLVASAQLTLSEKAEMAKSPLMYERIYQALYSKANFWLNASVTNLKVQKEQNFAKSFVKGNSSIDIKAIVHYWLSGYNAVPVLDSNGQPTDSQILNSAQLDVVFDNLAGVVAGDNLLPAN